MNEKKPGFSRRALIVAIAVLVLAGGASVLLIAQKVESLDPRSVAAAPGPSGLMWVGGNRESSFMHPGLSCIDCHNRGEGPRFQIAGTVYTNLDEKDDWFGVEGATVQVTDTTGKIASFTTNKAGNFFSGRSASLSAPFEVKVLKGGAERAMGSPAPSGNCASCHTAAGANGAPGRVIAP